MKAKRSDRLAELIADVEELAKRMRKEVQRAARKSGLTKNLETAANTLRKRAAAVAGQVEKYVHEVRMELVKGAPANRRRMARRRPGMNGRPSSRAMDLGA